MRILLLTDKPPWPGDSGGAVATQSIIRIIIEKRHDLTLMSLRTLKHNGCETDIPETIRNRIESIFIDHKVNISFPGIVINLLFSRKPYNLERFISKKFGKELTALLINREFDIVQFEGLAMNNYFDIVKLSTKARVVMRAHNLEHEIWACLAQESKVIYQKLYSAILAKRVRRVEKDCIDLYDGLITISADDMQKFRLLGIGVKAITLYPTMQVVKTARRNEDSINHTIGFIGSLDWKPNLSGLIWFMDYVWVKVSEAFPDVKFIIAGRNPGKPIQKRMARLGVSYIGSPASSEDFISSVDVLVVPLFSGSGIRLKIIESILYGTRVVTTSKGAEGLPIEITEEINITNNAETMATMIVEELSKKREDQVISKSLKDSADRFFGILAETDHLISFYSSLINDF